MGIQRSARVPAQLWAMTLDPVFSYWTEPVYTIESLANHEAEVYGGKVVKHFYCDDENPAWFLSFDDFDKAAKHVYDYL